ncbi:MAG: hypothetical protein ACOY94_16435 [Bacillota bacterium]
MPANGNTQLLKLAISVVSVAALAGVAGRLSGQESPPVPTAPDSAIPEAFQRAPWRPIHKEDEDDDDGDDSDDDEWDDDEWDDDDDDDEDRPFIFSRPRTEIPPHINKAQVPPPDSSRQPARTRRS